MQDGDKVLSQADIDAMLSAGAQGQATPAETATESLPEPTVREPAKQPEAPPPQTEFIQAEIARMSQQLERLEESIAQVGRQQRMAPDAGDAVRQLEESLQAVNSKVDSIIEDLQSTVGYRMRAKFVCDSCGSQGHVASRFTCTSCLKEDLWGWFPPKQ